MLSFQLHDIDGLRQWSQISTDFGDGEGEQSGLKKRGSKRYERLRGLHVEHVMYFARSSHWSRISLTAKQLSIMLCKKKCIPSGKLMAGSMPQDAPCLGSTKIVPFHSRCSISSSGSSSTMFPDSGCPVCFIFLFLAAGSTHSLQILPSSKALRFTIAKSEA